MSKVNLKECVDQSDVNHSTNDTYMPVTTSLPLDTAPDTTLPTPLTIGFLDAIGNLKKNTKNENFGNGNRAS